LIVTDKDAGEAYVVMSLSEYEAMISKLEGSKNTAASHLEPEDDYGQEYPDFEEEMGVEEGSIGDEERFYLEPIE